jgi:hypothetical protein
MNADKKRIDSIVPADSGLAKDILNAAVPSRSFFQKMSAFIGFHPCLSVFIRGFQESSEWVR